jgi:large-conductance mechanosensitive channel
MNATAISNLDGGFKEFIINNNVITTMIAVTAAFSTGTMIRSLAGDIVLPAIYKIFAHRITSLSGAFAPINKLNLDNFLKEFFSWIIVLILTFLLIWYVFRLWILNDIAHKPKPVDDSKTTSESIPIPTPAPIIAPITAHLIAPEMLSEADKNNDLNMMSGSTITEYYYNMPRY